MLYVERGSTYAYGCVRMWNMWVLSGSENIWLVMCAGVPMGCRTSNDEGRLLRENWRLPESRLGHQVS